jgi:hypothetical protein
MFNSTQKLMTIITFVSISSIALAQQPAQVINFQAISSCMDEDGVFLLTTTERHMTITQSAQGTINLVAKGECPTSSNRAVKFDNYDFNIACNGGVAGLLPYWKYHMRPDGNYTLKCSSH